MKRNFTKLSLTLLLACMSMCLSSINSNGQTYCTPPFVNGCDVYFVYSNYNVTLNTLNWTIPAPSGTTCTVSDYTSLSTTLVAGTGYPMSVTSTGYTGCSVWIDLNNDGIFESSENFFHNYSAGSGGTFTYTFTLTIPACTPTGTHRMRVLAGWGSDGFTPGGNGFGPCGSVDTPYQYGSFDDFTINVTGLPCDTATHLVVDTVGTTTAVFSWLSAPCAVGYEYIINTSPATPTGPGTTTTDTFVDASGLTPGTTYYLHLLTKCSSTDSSGWTETTTTTINVCGEPVTPAVSGITPTSATFTWGIPSGTFTVNDYQYTLNTTGIAPTGPGTATTATSYTATGLTPGTTYYFYVRTLCSSGDSSVWEEVTFTTPLPCDPPTGLIVSGVTTTDATINWTSPGGATVGNYQYVLTAVGSTPTAPGTAIGATSYSATGLTPATVYYFYVRTMCADGDSSAWVLITFTTEQPCDPPIDITAGSITDNSAVISWSNPLGGATVGNFQYLVNTSPSSPTGAGVVTSGNTYTATGLAAVTTYYFHVRTMCADGDSSAWETISFTTLPICGTPTILTNSITDQGIHIVWTSVFDVLEYQYALDHNPTPPATYGTATTDTEYNLIGLDSVTTYYFHLGAICSAGNSPWTTISFTTTNQVINVNSPNDLAITVSPNPAKDFATVSITGTQSGTAYVQLIDMTGRVLQNNEVSGKKVQLDLSYLPQAIYFVQYIDDVNKQIIKLVK